MSQQPPEVPGPSPEGDGPPHGWSTGGHPGPTYGSTPYGPQPGYGEQGYGPQGFSQQGFSQQGYGPQGFSQPGQPPYAEQPGMRAPVSASDEKTWGIVTHLSIPFVGFVGPLVVHLLYRDRSRFLRDLTTEALNFSILYSLVVVASTVLSVVGIGVVLYFIAAVGALVLCVLAAVAASRHESYQYPVNWRLIK